MIETRNLPADTEERIWRSLLTLEQFPQSGKPLVGAWSNYRALIGPWGWVIVSGASATLKVKLSGAAKAELAKGKTLKAKASGSGVVGSTVKLKPAKH